MRWIIANSLSAVTEGPRKLRDRRTVRVLGGADERAGGGGTRVAEAGDWWIVRRWCRIDGDGPRRDGGGALVVGHRECHREIGAPRDAVGMGRVLHCRCATVPKGPRVARDRSGRHVSAGADERTDRQRTRSGEPGARWIHRNGGGDRDRLSFEVARALVVGYRERHGKLGGGGNGVGMRWASLVRRAAIAKGPGVARDRSGRHVGAGADERTERQRSRR